MYARRHLTLRIIKRFFIFFSIQMHWKRAGMREAEERERGRNQFDKNFSRAQKSFFFNSSLLFFLENLKKLKLQLRLREKEREKILSQIIPVTFPVKLRSAIEQKHFLNCSRSVSFGSFSSVNVERFRAMPIVKFLQQS